MDGRQGLAEFFRQVLGNTLPTQVAADVIYGGERKLPLNREFHNTCTLAWNQSVQLCILSSPRNGGSEEQAIWSFGGPHTNPKIRIQLCLYRHLEIAKQAGQPFLWIGQHQGQ